MSRPGKKAVGFVKAFRDYLIEHQAEIDARQILYSRPCKSIYQLSRLDNFAFTRRPTNQ